MQDLIKMESNLWDECTIFAEKIELWGQNTSQDTLNPSSCKGFGNFSSTNSGDILPEVFAFQVCKILRHYKYIIFFKELFAEIWGSHRWLDRFQSSNFSQNPPAICSLTFRRNDLSSSSINSWQIKGQIPARNHISSLS